MPIGPDKEITHKTCPFKASAAPSGHEVGRTTSPREMCTHTCALYDEKAEACVIRLIATRMAQPLSVFLQGADLEKLRHTFPPDQTQTET